MKPFTTPSAERLEDRIAPAGLITATFANGSLTIDGADNANHDIHIVKTGAKTFRVEGNLTDVNTLGQASQTFKGKLKQITINGGTGGDLFELDNLKAFKGLDFNGNAGIDSLSAENLKTKNNAHVEIALGSEAGSVAFSGNKTTVHGFVNVDLGGGGGTLSIASTKTTIDKDVTITGGVGSDSVLITSAVTVLKNKLTFNAGNGTDSFNSTGQSLKVLGAVAVDGEGGNNTFVFAANKSKFGKSGTVGLVDVKVGSGPGSVTFGGNSTKVLGDVKVDLGAGGSSAHLISAVTNIKSNVQVTGGAANDTLEFTGRTSIGKSLSFLGNTGNDTLTADGTLFSVKGASSMDGGSGANSFDIDVTKVALAGLNVVGGALNDSVSIVADGNITGNASILLGADGTGNSTIVLQSKAGVANGLKFGGTLTLDMVGATTDFLTIAQIQVAKAFVAQTGEDVSTVNISNLNGKSDFKVQTGSGADVVNIDNINSKAFYVDTQIGADTLHIERNAAYIGTTNVLGIATILTGIGADQIRIGDSSNAANLKVSFGAAMTLDAGDGANMRNDIVGSNSFAIAPTITATGGVLTETAAP